MKQLDIERRVCLVDLCLQCAISAQLVPQRRFGYANSLFFLLRYMVVLAEQERFPLPPPPPPPPPPRLLLYPPQSFLPSYTTTPTPFSVFLLLPPSPFPSTFHNPPQVQHKSCNTQLKNETRLGLTRGLGVGGWGFRQEKERKGRERAGLMVKEGKGMQRAGCVMVGRGKDVDEGISADGESLLQNFLAWGPIKLIPMICMLHSLLHSFS